MEIPEYERFPLANLDELRSECLRLNLDIPVGGTVLPLGESLGVGAKLCPNRFCVQPMEGNDAQFDGSPGSLTCRRYRQYAEGGFGLIWVEATAVLAEARSNSSQLYLHEDNVPVFAKLTDLVRRAAVDTWGRDVVLILQLTHAGRFSQRDGALRPLLAHHNPRLDRMSGISDTYPLVSDDYLDRLLDTYVAAARHAAEAGFDGVDVKSCHNCLLAELLAASTRPGKYGGSFEGRTRFLREAVARIREQAPGWLVTTRMSGYDGIPWPHGFGVDAGDCRKPDAAEPIRLAQLLDEAGVSLLNVSVGRPEPDVNAGGDAAGTPAESPTQEHPLQGIARNIGVTAEIQKGVPDLPIVGGGYSWLRQFLPYVGAGIVEQHAAAIVGMGRGALAYPDAVKDILSSGNMDPAKCCMICGACRQLMRDGGRTGCVIRDPDVYGREYRHQRRFALDHVAEEARRCHDCEAAPCSAACPAHIDVPAFIKAFADGNVGAAYEVMRRANVLPEMCAHLCPTWMLCEGACIEATLTGRPVPIHDIQYVACWLAREEGDAAVKIEGPRSGKCVAVVGGGPTGVACAVKLAEKGHEVVLIERDERLGGTPELVIPAGRYMGARAEIDAVLQPALDAGLLEIQFGQELGRHVVFEGLREEYDAILLAAGAWQERSLGKAEGVIDALSFLRKAKRDGTASVPARVAVLSGGDCAMDAAVTARSLGAYDVYVVYGGSRADMHWHMSEDWFANPGVHCMTLCQPIGYELDADGRLAGLKFRRQNAAEGNREAVLEIDMVVEAMGLGVSDGLRQALPGIALGADGLVQTAAEGVFSTGVDGVFAAGGLVNGGASVAQCVAEGMRAAAAIDEYLAAGRQAGGANGSCPDSFDALTAKV